MEIKTFSHMQSSLRAQRNFAVLMCLFLLTSNLTLSIWLFNSEKQVILVPPNLEREVALSEEKLNRGYLEEMGTFFLSKMLDLSSHNIDSQSAVVLRHTAPSFYNQMKEFFQNEKQKYAEYNLTTYFIANSVEVIPEELTVVASGTLLSQFASSGKSEEPVTYHLTFDYIGGILTISNFELSK